MVGLGEILVLVGVIVAAFALLRPLRRRLEVRFARLLRRPGRRGGRVIVLQRRDDGTFGRGGGRGG